MYNRVLLTGANGVIGKVLRPALRGGRHAPGAVGIASSCLQRE